MSIRNKLNFSQYKYIKPQPQKINNLSNAHMPNAITDEIFQAQKIDIKTLESKVSELTKQIKELKIENKTLRKFNALQEKELRKTNVESTGVSFLTQSYKEEIRVIQSKVSSLQEQLKVSENSLKNHEKIVLKKSLQIENLTTAKIQHEKIIKEMALENKKSKNEKDLVSKKFQELLEKGKELESRNEELQQQIKNLTNKILELEESVRSAENNKTKLEKDLYKLKKKYDELEQNLSLTKSCPTLAETGDISNERTLYLESDAGSKVCYGKNAVSSDLLNAMGDCCWEGDNCAKNIIQEEKALLATDSVCKAKLSGLHAYQYELISHLPLPKIQKKETKLRHLCSLKAQCNDLGFFPVNSSFIVKPFASISDLSVPSKSLQSNYSMINAQSMKFFSSKMS